MNQQQPFSPDQPSKQLKASFHPAHTDSSAGENQLLDHRRGSPTPPTGSFDGAAKSVFHQKRAGRKKQSMPSFSHALDSAIVVGSPQNNEAGNNESGGAIQPGQNRMTRQQARTMRISQQRILRETSLETVQNSQGVPFVSSHPTASQSQARNFASEGFSFKSISEQQNPASQGPPQKLVKKVAMKAATSGTTALGTMRQSSLTYQKQKSLTHRQGPILQNGPHTRSKSSAIGGDTSIQIQSSNGNNNRAVSRKSNSRGRGTPQNRLTMVQPQQHLRKSTQKRSFEGAQQVQPPQHQQQKSCITITSPKDSANGDLNTSMPLPTSKSNNRVALDKNQISVGTSRQQNVLKHQPSGPQAHHVQSASTSKAMATPSGPTYQHTRKQSTTKHRSNSKKRGSINTSIKRQIARSPDAGQRASSLLNNSIQTNLHQLQQLQTAPAQQTTQSKQSTKASQVTKLTQQQQTSTIVPQWSKDKAQMTANAASAFSQQYATSTTQHQSSQQVSAEQIMLKPSQQSVTGETNGSGANNSNFVLAMSAAAGLAGAGNPPPQGHRLTPLIQSSKTGRLSNERKNRSVLYEATTAGDQDHGVMAEMTVLKSESRLKDTNAQLNNDLAQGPGNMDSSEMLINMLKDGLQKKQQQILTAAVNHPENHVFNMKGGDNALANANHQQQMQKAGSLLDSHIGAPSSFSSFSKQVPSKLEAKRHQSAQKVLRPKNSLPATQPSTEMISSSPTGIRRGTVQHGKSSGTVSTAYSQQQQAQVVQMMLKQQSRQQVSTVDPVPIQQRLSHNLPHQQSMLSSAQSSRTALDLYLKKTLKSNNQMSSRTVNSVQSGITPYELGVHKRATTAQELVKELYGSNQEGRGEMPPGQLSSGSGAKSTITGVTFHDFHPKSSITSMHHHPGESKSQMMLEKEVQGLSPEPRAEIILSKNQIQRATREKFPEQVAATGANQVIAISKQDSRTQNLHKLKLQQIQQASQSSQRDTTKKVIKSQRMIQNHPKHHAKSFSNAHSGHQSNFMAEPGMASALNQNYLRPKHQQQQAFSATNQDPLSKVSATKSASKVQNNSSKFMVQNWICSADPTEEQTGLKTVIEPVKSQTKKGHTSRPMTNHRVKNLDPRSNVFQQMQQDSGLNSLHARSLFSSEHQTTMPQVSQNAKLAPGVPVFNASMDEQQSTQSQRLLLHQNNQHQLSMQQIQQNLKSVHVAADNRGLVGGPTTASVLRSGRSAKDQQSMLQAEQSRQKILGPLTAQNAKHQPQLVSQDHNAYANNAEDYFKKAPIGTKTPAEKPSKKLTKGGAPSGKRTAMGLKTGVVASSQPGSSGQPLTQSSMETSPQVEKQMNLLDNVSQRDSNMPKTQSAMTMSAAQSMVSQNSSQNEQAVADHGKINNNVTYGVAKSRLSQYVQQPSSAAKSNSFVSSHIPQASAPSTATKLKKKKLQSSTHGPNQQQFQGSALKKSSPTAFDDSAIGKGVGAQSRHEKATLTQSELMRKKNQAKIIGVSSLSMKQQQNLQMQQLLGNKNNRAGERERGRGTGAVLQKDPDNTVISASAVSKVQGNQRRSPTRLPNTIHGSMKMMHSGGNGRGVNSRPHAQIGVYPGAAAKQQSSDQTYFSHNVKEREGKQSSQKVMKYAHQQVYPEGMPASATSSFQMSEKRPSQPKLALSRMESLNLGTEARSQTALGQQTSQDGLSHNSRYNLSQPAVPVSDFEAPSQLSAQGQQMLALNQQKSTGVSSFQQIKWSPQERFEINHAMPQRHNKANYLERVDKKLGKNELLMTSQLSTTTSHSSSSFKEEKAAQQRSRFQQQQQFLSHCVTFDAHANSVVGLQATSGLTGANQFASFSIDNSVKLWSVTTERPTELISNNRAAAVNLPSRVVLKRQVKNQARPSQKLSSFAFLNGQAQQQHSSMLESIDQRKSTIMVTGSTDKVLKLYVMDVPEQPEDYTRMDFMRRQDRGVSSADVMQPELKVTGQHRGVISSIVQLPDQSNDLFLTGCSDGQIRMFSLSSLTEESDDPIRSFDQGRTGVQQICAMSENTFLSSGFDNSVRLWDVRAQDHQRLLKDSNFGKLTCLQKYSNGIFASACNDGLVNFWDMRKMQLVKQVEMPSHGSISAIQFLKKRQYLIAAHDHKLSIINISADSATATTAASKQNGVNQQQSFTVSALEEAQNAPNGPSYKGRSKSDHAVTTENAWGKGAKITSMVYSEADRKVYTGGFNKKISVWNVYLENFN